jgi:hypothetical protein
MVHGCESSPGYSVFREVSSSPADARLIHSGGRAAQPGAEAEEFDATRALPVSWNGGWQCKRSKIPARCNMLSMRRSWSVITADVEADFLNLKADDMSRGRARAAADAGVVRSLTETLPDRLAYNIIDPSSSADCMGDGDGRVGESVGCRIL